MQPPLTTMERALAAVIARERLLKDHNSPDPLREIFRPAVGRRRAQTNRDACWYPTDLPPCPECGAEGSRLTASKRNFGGVLCYRKCQAMRPHLCDPADAWGSEAVDEKKDAAIPRKLPGRRRGAAGDGRQWPQLLRVRRSL